MSETTLTLSDSIEAGAPVGSEIVRVVSHSTTEITEITRFLKKPRSSGSDTLIPNKICSRNRQSQTLARYGFKKKIIMSFHP